MGCFQNASEVIRAGLRLIENQEAGLMEVRAGLLEGIAQADRGETIDGEEAIRSTLRPAKAKREKRQGLSKYLFSRRASKSLDAIMEWTLERFGAAKAVEYLRRP